MNKKELISNLTSNLKPVKRFIPCKKCMVVYSILTIVLTSIFVYFYGIRPDLCLACKKSSFLLDTFFLALLSISASFVAFKTMTPTKISKAAYLPFLFLAFWCLSILFKLICAYKTCGPCALQPGPGLNCLKETIIIATIPFLIISTFLSSITSTRPIFTGVMISLACASIATFALQFICNGTTPAHLLFWHFLPVIIICLLGLLIGKKILKW
jgi:hypothetical protein